MRDVEPARSVRRRVAPLLAALTALAAGAAAASPVAAHGAVPPDPPTVVNLLLGWDFDPIVSLGLLGSTIWWWRMLGAIDRDHPDHPVPASQRWAFLAGLLAIAFALLSGIARYDTTLFSVHMVQHILLTLVAPPLLALGAPVTQLLRASSPRTRQRYLLPILHSRLVGILAHPVVAWVAFAGVMWGTHFSPIFNQSLEDPTIHDLEHVAYLVAGLLFWWPAVGLDPAPRRMSFPGRIAYVFLQMPQNSFLGMAILFAQDPLYPHYATLGSPYGIDALADQRLAAGIMWFLGDIVFMIATLALLGAWMQSEDRATAGAERRADPEREAIRVREAALRRRKAADGVVPELVTADQIGPEASRSER
jgi:cytochrome c oxidase assembly factor CtaG